MSRNFHGVNGVPISRPKLPFFGTARPDSESEAQLYLQRALQASDEERYDVALVFCEKVLQVAPGNLAARFLTGQIHDRVLGDVDAAVAAYRKVITLGGYDAANPYVAAAREALDALVTASTAP